MPDHAHAMHAASAASVPRCAIDDMPRKIVD